MGGGFCGVGFGIVGVIGGSCCCSLYDCDVGGVYLWVV